MRNLTLTLRVHDPEEKTDEKQSTRWVVLSVPREDMLLDSAALIAKWIAPAIEHLKQIAPALPNVPPV